MTWVSFIFIFVYGIIGHSLPSEKEQQSMVGKVNEIRTKGCYCGKKYYAPVKPIHWDNTLYKSALKQAEEMEKHHFFNHFSKEGLNIGDRLDLVGYQWEVAGENLGEGQKTFDEVLGEWLASYSHCTMLMHPKVEEMAVAQYGKYWVQHFGKRMKQR